MRRLKTWSCILPTEKIHDSHTPIILHKIWVFSTIWYCIKKDELNAWSCRLHTEESPRINPNILQMCFCLLSILSTIVVNDWQNLKLWSSFYRTSVVWAMGLKHSPEPLFFYWCRRLAHNAQPLALWTGRYCTGHQLETPPPSPTLLAR